MAVRGGGWLAGWLLTLSARHAGSCSIVLLCIDVHLAGIVKESLVGKHEWWMDTGAGCAAATGAK